MSVNILHKSSAATKLSDCMATTEMSQKVGGGAAVPLSLGGEAGSPSNTMSPGLRPISVPSDILIHPAIWPQ